MEYCNKCGVSSEVANLYDAITSEGIQKICPRCLDNENLPLIKKATEEQIEEADKKPSMKQRISDFKGAPLPVKKDHLSMRDLVENKIGKDYSRSPKFGKEVIRNFHWDVMKARRNRKLTHEQLGKEIGESEETIKLVEQGKLPDDSSKLLNKLEEYLEIKIIKVPGEEPSQQKWESMGKRQEQIQDNSRVTIADLRKFHDKKDVHEEFSLQEPEEVSESTGKSPLISGFRKRFGIGNEEVPEVEEEKMLKEKVDEELEKRIVGVEKLKKNPENLTEDEINDILFRK